MAPLLFGFKSKRYEYLLRVRLSVKIILYHSYLPSYNLFIYDSVIIFHIIVLVIYYSTVLRRYYTKVTFNTYSISVHHSMVGRIWCSS